MQFKLMCTLGISFCGDLTTICSGSPTLSVRGDLTTICLGSPTLLIELNF